MWASRTEGRTVTWTQMLSVDIWASGRSQGEERMDLGSGLRPGH